VPVDRPRQPDSGLRALGKRWLVVRCYACSRAGDDRLHGRVTVLARTRKRFCGTGEQRPPLPQTLGCWATAGSGFAGWLAIGVGLQIQAPASRPGTPSLEQALRARAFCLCDNVSPRRWGLQTCSGERRLGRPPWCIRVHWQDVPHHFRHSGMAPGKRFAVLSGSTTPHLQGLFSRRSFLILFLNYVMRSRSWSWGTGCTFGRQWLVVRNPLRPACCWIRVELKLELAPVTSSGDRRGRGQRVIGTPMTRR